LLGYISKGITLGGKGQLRDAMEALDLGFTFSNSDSMVIDLLLLVKVRDDILIPTENFNVVYRRPSHFLMRVITMRQCDEFKT